MKNKILNTVGMVAMVIVLFTGCKKLDLIPEDEFTESTYWTSEAKARSVLNTAYSQMSNSAAFFYNEALSDNAVMGRGDAQGASSISRGTHDPSLARFNEEWRQSYAGIKTTNIFLENVDRVPDVDEATKNRMKAEARFIRALKHFQLMTWFGDVPLISQDVSLEEARTLTRTPRAQVLAFVLSELDAVVEHLPVNTGLAATERGMLTKGAALGLKARVLLYEGEWQQVVETCEMLMNNSTYGSYGLFPSYTGLFHPDNEYSQEDILSMQYVPERRTWGEYFDLAPISVGSRLNAMAPTQELVDSYLMINGRTIDEAGSGYNEDNPYVNRDPRLTGTVVYHLYRWDADGGTPRIIYTKPGTAPDATTKLDEYSPGSSASPTGYYWRKYYDPKHSTGMASSTNLMLIRYADILLMYAEAKNELGQLNEAVWNQTIRPLRERAGFTDAAALNFPGAGQSDLREIVRNERRVELALEGLRIFDIRRWRIADEVLNGWVHGARFGSPSEDRGYIRVVERTFDEGKHYLWPVPRDERNINPNLSQNTGWN